MRESCSKIIIHSYIIEENTCFLTLTEKSISKRTIFSFLEEVKTLFFSFIQSENTEEYVYFVSKHHLIAGEQRLPQWLVLMLMLVSVFPFSSSMRFSWCNIVDKDIQIKRKMYDQQNGSLDSYNQINESLMDIQNIMRMNIDEVVQRVEKLDRKFTLMILITVQMSRMQVSNWSTTQRNLNGVLKSWILWYNLEIGIFTHRL